MNPTDRDVMDTEANKYTACTSLATFALREYKGVINS
jgi:hypothetical protein